ncbi:MAG: hypothetical protein R2695_17440 [Acidimicrobiales bacterium]
MRQSPPDVGRQNAHIHVTRALHRSVGQTEDFVPTQHSVTELRSRGIQPDAIVCRSEEPISADLRRLI